MNCYRDGGGGDRKCASVRRCAGGGGLQQVREKRRSSSAKTPIRFFLTPSRARYFPEYRFPGGEFVIIVYLTHTVLVPPKKNTHTHTNTRGISSVFTRLLLTRLATDDVVKIISCDRPRPPCATAQARIRLPHK